MFISCYLSRPLRQNELSLLRQDLCVRCWPSKGLDCYDQVFSYLIDSSCLLIILDWERVGTLNSQGTAHSLLTAEFSRLAEAEGLQIPIAESFPDTLGKTASLQLEKLDSNGVKIIFLAADWQDAIPIVRESKTTDTQFDLITSLPTTQNLRKKDVVFIGSDAWMSPQIFNGKVPRMSNCSLLLVLLILLQLMVLSEQTSP